MRFPSEGMLQIGLRVEGRPARGQPSKEVLKFDGASHDCHAFIVARSRDGVTSPSLRLQPERHHVDAFLDRPNTRAAMMCRVRPRYVFIIIIAAGGLVLAASLALWAVTGTRLVEFPPWLESVSAFATFIAAVTAGIFAVAAFKIEFDRDVRWHVAQRRSQAALVAAWVYEAERDEEFETDDDGFEFATDIGLTAVRVKVRNASELPVTNVAIRVRLTAATDDGNGMDREIGTAGIAVLEPSPEAIQVVVLTPFDFIDEGAALPPDYTVHVSTQFVDAADLSWERTSSGRLRETNK
jgi:hypothetical protein